MAYQDKGKRNAEEKKEYCLRDLLEVVLCKGVQKELSHLSRVHLLNGLLDEESKKIIC